MKEKFGCRKIHSDGRQCRKEIWRDNLCDWWDFPFCDECLLGRPLNVEQMNWINMRENPPIEDQEILFIADEDITNERIGMAFPESRIVILKRTDISFDDVHYWLPIPEMPKD